MSNFWEKSPLWKRKQDLRDVVAETRERMEDAGEWLLSLVQIGGDTPASSQWLNRRASYLDAVEAYSAALAAWKDTREAYEASPVGQAEARYFADPLAVRVKRGHDFYDPANALEFAEAAS